MSSPNRAPRRSKRQKRESADATTIESEEKLSDQHSANVPHWKAKAEEALAHRNRSLAEISSQLPEININIKSKAQYIRARLLEDTPDNVLLRLTPEAIVRSISRGKLDSHTMTKAFLLRSGMAAKLVSGRYPQSTLY